MCRHGGHRVARPQDPVRHEHDLSNDRAAPSDPRPPRTRRHADASGAASAATGEARKNLNADEKARCTQNTRMGLSPAWWFTAATAKPYRGEPRSCGSPCPICVFRVNLSFSSALNPCLLRRAPHAAATDPGPSGPARTPCTHSPPPTATPFEQAGCRQPRRALPKPLAPIRPPPAAPPFEQAGCRQHRRALPKPLAPIRRLPLLRRSSRPDAGSIAVRCQNPLHQFARLPLLRRSSRPDAGSIAARCQNPLHQFAASRCSAVQAGRGSAASPCAARTPCTNSPPPAAAPSKRAGCRQHRRALPKPLAPIRPPPAAPPSEQAGCRQPRRALPKPLAPIRPPPAAPPFEQAGCRQHRRALPKPLAPIQAAVSASQNRARARHEPMRQKQWPAQRCRRLSAKGDAGEGRPGSIPPIFLLT